jgi:hypothetical protein
MRFTKSSYRNTSLYNSAGINVFKAAREGNAMGPKQKFKLTKLRIIEAISIAAGLATLLSSSQNFIGRYLSSAKPTTTLASTDSKFAIRPRALPGRMFGVHKVLNAEMIGDPIVSDKAFNELVYAEMKTMESLPPLVVQLHKDVRTLNFAKSSQSGETKEVRDLHVKVVNDREAIMHVLLNEQETIGEIVPPADRDRIENAVRL